MKAGEHADTIFFVCSGIVEISAMKPEDPEYKVSAIAEKGDCFGDDVFARTKRTTFAHCRTDVEVLKLKKDDLDEVLQACGDAKKLQKAVEKQSAFPCFWTLFVSHPVV